MIEIGPRRCLFCGKLVGYRSLSLAAANMVLIVGLLFCVALSIKLRGWWPYGLVPIVYAVDRAILMSVGQPIELARKRNLSILWGAILLMFLFALAKLAASVY